MCEPVMIACYCGVKKPDLIPFLQDFIDEIKHVRQVRLRNKNVPLLLQHVIADLPAKAFVKQTKGHSGYSSCHFCCTRGEQSKGGVRFLETDCSLRTDTNFRAQQDLSHHIGDSPFLSLPINMIKSFPVDYMHCSCLGVVKRILMFLMTGKRKCRLRNFELDIISQKLQLLRSDIPHEFARKPRALCHFKKYKATEFRQILLYTSLVIFRNHPQVYSLFKVLLVAHFIMLDESMSKDIQLVNYAGELLIFFINTAQRVLGRDFVTLNVHQLMHLHQQVSHFN
jgi:hypothetical protein